ncbi:MAG: hypothetical protein RIQ54_232 [Candidatus Parcubacteria bacterium]|jgi:cell division protein FtsI (penicillin-binding protein 3)/stage V sporulation protein D (sporulation-specific penicillin-binding protein)
MVTRLVPIAFAVVAAYGFLVMHLYSVQVRQGSYYSSRASSQVNASGVLFPARGSIFFTDKNGNRVPVAMNKEYPVVYAVPKTIDDAQEVSARLAPILHIDADDLLKKISRPDSYRLLTKRATDDMVRNVKDLHIEGIYTDTAPARYYPMSTVASHLLGFVGYSNEHTSEQGKYGLEEEYNSILQGRDGVSESGKLIPAASGNDITISIDPSIQIEAERILQQLVDQYDAESGTVIVQEPSTGKLLAMGSVPHFDPNTYGQSTLSSLLNPAISQIYEPGSVFKVITMAAGIDSGSITADTTFLDTGVLALDGYTIRNWDKQAHGTVTMTNVIEQSLNTGAAFAQRKTGNGLFKQYLTRFGFGEKTEVDLPGELKGDMRRLFSKDAVSVEFATASFGQGVAVTPLQMINSFSAIANGGQLMRPYLNVDMNPKIVRRVISPETASIISTMMVSAVDKAKVAQIPGYRLAGKTGTAFIPDFKRGGYTDQVINTYVGFGPVAHPRFTILFKLVKPSGAPLAGQTVVPAFRSLAEFLINYYNIPPDRID